MKVRFNTPPTEAVESNGLPLRYAAAKRHVPRLRWYFLVALVATPLLYFSSNIFLAAIWDSSPGFVVLNEVVVRAEVSGLVHTLLREGAAVSADKPLAHLRMPTSVEGAGYTNTTEPVTAKEVADGRPTPEEMEGVRARINQANAVLPLVREQVAVAARRRTAIEQLVLQGAATAAEQAQAQGQWAVAEADRLRAEAELGSARLALQNLKARIATPSGRSASSVASLSTGLNGTFLRELRAPIAGNQLHWLAHDGEWVAAGSDVAVIYLPDEPVIRVYISPADMPDARVGVHTELEFMDGGRIPATVVRIGTEAARIPPERVGPLATRMQSVVADLKPDTPLPAQYRINSLPLDVRFSRISRLLR
jgi:HlyD family secretion protein